MKRLGIILSTLLLIIGLCGCQTETDPVQDEALQAEYQEFVASLPAMLIKGDNTVVNQLFSDPEAIGIEVKIANWDSYDLNEAKELDQTITEIAKTNESFERASLSKENQITYDFIEYLCDDGPNDIPLEAEYYLANNVLGAYEGVVSNVFITLYFYELRNENDVRSYLNLVNTLADYKDDLLSFERERQDKGYGMCQSEVELAIENLESLLQDGDFSFLLTEFKNKLFDLELDEKLKEQYAQEVEDNLEKELTLFYEGILKGLKELDIKQKDDVVLADLPYGQEYFENLIYENCGISDIDEYQEYVELKTSDVISEVMTLMSEYELTDLEKMFMGEIEFSDAADPNELLAYLSEAMKEDFPDIGSIAYDMVELPGEFGVLMPSTRAFYLIGTLDDPSATQRMMLNGTYSQEEFTTVAHEGFPGHMYQNSYMINKAMPYIYMLYGNDGYVEGYANYVQRFSTRYADDKDGAMAYELNNTLTYTVILMLDLEVNYQGEDISEDVESLFGLSGKDADALIEQLKFMPGAFICYYASGLMFDDLYEEILNVKEDLTYQEFHESILDKGPLPMDLLKEHLFAQYEIDE